MNEHKSIRNPDLETIHAVDAEARKKVLEKY
ncbi:MAG: hypothetical protein K0R18_1859 [Bacillales bacterium]|nr:hypothetical protein [Bacillales bacterium]